ncbi:hypothetical protein [Shouchella clausii]|uniref:hypothetical protein n=1 Tax=Shouchella clausii TaxID=79880 RepID=UPI000BA625DD|nr:hypothetical protein [Shouchella clausii]PAD46642.1 hypothetical protein CHI09_10980 [Shouchella clausii]
MLEMVASFITGIGVTGVMVWTFSTQIATRIIDKKFADDSIAFAQRLKDQSDAVRAEHEKSMQAIGHEFNKQIHNFSLYSKKRHEIYPKVYSLLLKASYPILLPSEKTFNLDENNSASVKAYFKDKVPDFVIDELLRIKEDHPSRYKKDFDELIKTTHYYIRYNDWVRANKLLLSSELFFESDTFKSANAISTGVYNLLVIQEQQMYGLWDREMFEERKAAMSMIEENITLLKDLMKRDINQESNN